MLCISHIKRILNKVHLSNVTEINLFYRLYGWRKDELWSKETVQVKWMKNENHSYLLSGKTIGNNSDDDDKIENKTNAYSLWIYTSSNICWTNKHKCFFVWQGHFQQFEFLLTPWIDILPISPTGVIQKEFLLKISSTKRWEERKGSSKEKVWFNKKFSDHIVNCKKFTTDCGELIFRYWKWHEIINNYSPRWRCVILSVYNTQIPKHLLISFNTLTPRSNL